MHKKERVNNDDYHKYGDNFHVCVKTFLLNVYFQVGDNVRVMLIQSIYERTFLYQVIKDNEKSFNLKSTKLNSLPLKRERKKLVK
jgi:hypothetical protein